MSIPSASDGHHLSESEPFDLRNAILEVHISEGPAELAVESVDGPLTCHACGATATLQAELGPDEPSNLPFGDVVMLCEVCVEAIAVADVETFQSRWQFEGDIGDFFEHVRDGTVAVWGVTAPHERSDLESVCRWLTR